MMDDVDSPYQQMANHKNMTTVESVKAWSEPRVVGVLASPADVQRALRLRRVPDFFELRLDCLASDLDIVRETIGRLPAPLVITARHPLEGGRNDLTAAERRELLLEFTRWARFVDVELRSVAELADVLDAVAKHQVGRIISLHQLREMPTRRELDDFAARAAAHAADILKIAVRIETQDELAELADFVTRESRRIQVSAMGVGHLGRASRLLMARRGSALNYVHLGTAGVEGQLSLAEMRRHLHRARRDV